MKPGFLNATYSTSRIGCGPSARGKHRGFGFRSPLSLRHFVFGLLLLCSPHSFLRAQSTTLINQVLVLDGEGSYVELPSGIFNHLTNATVEGWIYFERLDPYARFFDFGRKARSISVRVVAPSGLGVGVHESQNTGAFPNA